MSGTSKKGRWLIWALACLAGPALAQEGISQYPATSPAILNCAPADPAPQDTCLLRLPLGYDYSDPDIEPLGEERGEFRITREGLADFPGNLTMSATLLLVDLSPGPQGGRRATFETEKEMMLRFVNSLPRDSAVAVYGFNEQFQRLSDFTTDRTRLRDTIESLELGGTNTRIATFVTDAVTILSEQDDVLIRNIVLVSDGQEEGSRSVDSVIETANAAGVSISSMGAFWRPIGSSATGTGMDFLEDLARPTNGSAVQVLLRRGLDADNALGRFTSDYARSLERSALIVPLGTPQPSEISLRLSEPRIGGAPGETDIRTISVIYQPETPETEPEPSPEPAPEENLILGMPALWVYAAIGAIVVFALLALVGMALRSKSGDGPEGEPFGDPEPGGVSGDENTAMSAAPPAPPVRAYLVFSDDGRRVPIRGNQVNVGRSSSNEVVIEHKSVSRIHAQIHINRDGGFSVTDLDSLNKTKIRGEPIKGTQALRLGDALEFGDVAAKLVTA